MSLAKVNVHIGSNAVQNIDEIPGPSGSVLIQLQKISSLEGINMSTCCEAHNSPLIQGDNVGCNPSTTQQSQVAWLFGLLVGNSGELMLPWGSCHL